MQHDVLFSQYSSSCSQSCGSHSGYASAVNLASATFALTNPGKSSNTRRYGGVGEVRPRFPSQGGASPE